MIKLPTALLDLFLIQLLNIIILWVLSVILISLEDQSPPQPKNYSEFIITVTWDISLNADVDTWAMRKGNPNSKTGYKARENDVFILHNDNTSYAYGIVNGRRLRIAKETLTIERIVADKYLFSLQGFRIPDRYEPVEATVHIQKVSPYQDLGTMKVKVYGGQESPAFAMVINEDGTVEEFITDSLLLTKFLPIGD